MKNYHSQFMKEALKLSRRGENFVEPNPMVGCVIVKDNKIISTGYHKKFGSNHAEVEALNNLQTTVTKDMTMYVTLEPCTHFGKTPPCVNAIIKAGIKKIVIATLDPNPINTGKSIELLNKNMVKTIVGVLESEAKKINKIFFQAHSSIYPYIFSKVAMSIDGKIATHTGKSKWITSEAARAFVKKERSKYMAIMVGTNTILNDNPTLLGKNKNPIRIILDRTLKIPTSLNIFKNEYNAKNIIITSYNQRDNPNVKLLKGFVESIIFVNEFEEKLDIKEALIELKKMGITSIYVEGGSKLHWWLLNNNLCNRMQFIIAPIIIGGEKSLPSIGGKGVDSIAEAFKLRNIEIKRIKSEIIYEGDIL